MDQWKRKRDIECLVSKGSVPKEREDGNNVCVCVCVWQPERRRIESGKSRGVRER